MSAPLYVSPEQWYQDKAEYARKGIARGKPIVAVEYEGGLLLAGENRSTSLRKISEIYDRLAFAGVGKFDEYENLRKAGIRYADMRGYSYCREDVSGKSLANEYSTVLGSIFTREMKPFEVELLVGEVQDDKAALYQVSYDGSMVDHDHFASIGGDAELIRGVLREGWNAELSLVDAVRLGRKALEKGNGDQDLSLTEENLELALLERSLPGRKFHRIDGEEIKELLGG